MFIILVMNFDWWDVPENIHSQASLSSGEPIKCRVSLFSRGQKTIRPIINLVSYFFTCESHHGDYHSCPIGSVSIVRKIIQIRFTNGFQRRISLKKWGRRDFSRMQLRKRRSILKAWRTEAREKKTKRDVQLCEYTTNEAKGIWRKWLPREYRQTL